MQLKLLISSIQLSWLAPHITHHAPTRYSQLIKRFLGVRRPSAIDTILEAAAAQQPGSEQMDSTAWRGGPGAGGEPPHSGGAKGDLQLADRVSRRPASPSSRLHGASSRFIISDRGYTPTTILGTTAPTKQLHALPLRAHGGRWRHHRCDSIARSGGGGERVTCR